MKIKSNHNSLIVTPGRIRTRILQLLRECGPLSKIQIANELEISPSTAGVLCEVLMQEGIITVAGIGQSAGGRRPTLLQLNERAKFVLGCDIGVTHVVSVITDLSGKVLERSWITTDPRDESERILHHLRTSLQEVIDRAEATLERILGIGVSVPGLMDLDNGISVLAPNLPKWRNVPIVRFLKDAFNLPAFMVNDAGAMALGEHYFGAGRGYRDLVGVNIGVGIGAGIILDGRLYRGGAGGCGEIGHVTVNENGPSCPCGSNGCLELMAAGPAIAARAIQALSSAVPTAIETLAQGKPANVSARIVAEAARQGDKLAIEILTDAGRYVGIGVAMVVNLLSPTLIIIGGGVSQAGKQFFEKICSTVERRAYTTIVNKPAIVLSQLRGDASVLGAVALVLEWTFYSPNSPFIFAFTE